MKKKLKNKAPYTKGGSDVDTAWKLKADRSLPWSSSPFMFTSRQNQENLPAAGTLAARGGSYPSGLSTEDVVTSMFLKQMYHCSQGYAVMGQGDCKATYHMPVHFPNLQEERRFVYLKFVLHIYLISHDYRNAISLSVCLLFFLSFLLPSSSILRVSLLLQVTWRATSY